MSKQTIRYLFNLEFTPFLLILGKFSTFLFFAEFRIEATSTFLALGYPQGFYS